MMVSPPVNSAGILTSKIFLTHSALLKDMARPES